MAEFSELIEAQLSGATVRLAAFVRIDFKSGEMRLWQGYGKQIAGGEEWQGVGNLGALTPIQSGPRGAVEEINLSLFGEHEFLENIEADADESIGREVNFYLQFFDVRRFNEAGVWVDWQPLDDMISWAWGRMGPLSVSRQPPSERGRALRTISVVVQNALVNRRRPPFGYFSDRDQKARGSADDEIFSRMAEFSEGTVRWPQFGSGTT